MHRSPLAQRLPRLRLRNWRSLVAFGAIALAGTAAAEGKAAAGSMTVEAAPPPAFVVAAAIREASSLGDQSPTSARYVLTRHRQAVETSSGASVVANQPVYLIVLTGQFKTGPVGPAPGRIVTGTFATEILDARTGRETDFSIGPKPVHPRSVGIVGDLLPYMRGTAHPACSAPDLTATAEFQGATGSQLGGLTLTNRSTLACALPRSVNVRLSWRRRPLRVKTTPFPPGWLTRMNPRWGQPVTVLAPQGRAQVILQWFNWCGPTPWGHNRALHLTVAVHLPHQVAAVKTTTSELVDAPRCDLKPSSGTGSTLRVSPFVRGS